ncbi:COPII coat GTPase [Binucleata daphniae]
MENIINYYARIKDQIVKYYKKALHQFIHTIFPHNVSILFLGIDNAGKTTLLNLLKDTQSATKPTSHPTSTDVQIGNLHAVVFDLGGHEPARLIWEKFFYKCNGVVFIVDAFDSDRFDSVKEAYGSVNASIRKIKKTRIPINVLINKMDKVYSHFENDVQQIENYCENMLNHIGIEEGENVKVTYVTMVKDVNTQRHDKGIYDSFLWLDNITTMMREKGEL